MTLNSIEEIIEDLRQGKMVVMMDDEDRENEGDIVMAAEKVTPFHVNFMARFARGLICLPLTKERCEQLRLPLMVSDNYSKFGTNFTLSIEAAKGVTTGISAQDRAHTILTAVHEHARSEDIVQPGHIFPIMAQPGGVLVRAGHTEASVDLARLAGLSPAGVLCEILNEDGTMARRGQLEIFARTHGLKLGTIASLIQYRLARESTIKEIARYPFHHDAGQFELVIFQDVIMRQSHLALVYGKPEREKVATVRVHLNDVLLDIPGAKWDLKDRWPLEAAICQVAASKLGAVILLSGQVPYTFEKLMAGLKQEEHSPKGESQMGQEDWRLIGVGSQILSLLGFGKICLLGTKKHYCALSGFGLEVTETLSYKARINTKGEHYGIEMA